MNAPPKWSSILIFFSFLQPPSQLSHQAARWSQAKSDTAACVSKLWLQVKNCRSDQQCNRAVRMVNWGQSLRDISSVGYTDVNKHAVVCNPFSDSEIVKVVKPRNGRVALCRKPNRCCC
uniref:Putative secreted protein n=1 Tax=Ixodes ricinus TaxID=34613 RepID=A0A6B0UMR5_IXORI